MNKYYVYVYLDPRKPGKFEYGEYKFDFEPFYVGKGAGKRKFVHLWESCRKHEHTNIPKMQKIDDIKAAGFNLKDYIIVIKNEMSDGDSLIEETAAIITIGRLIDSSGPLTNIHDRGGRSPSAELHEKRSAAQRRSWTPERKAAHSQRMKYHYHKEGSLIKKGLLTPHDTNHKKSAETRRKQFKSGELSLAGSKNTMAKTWVFTDPNGIEHIIKGTSKKFCEHHNLSPWTMWEMAKPNGQFKKDTHRGWTCRYADV